MVGSGAAEWCKRHGDDVAHLHRFPVRAHQALMGARDRANPADESRVKVVEVDRIVTASLGQCDDGREHVLDTMVELGEQAMLMVKRTVPLADQAAAGEDRAAHRSQEYPKR